VEKPRFLADDMVHRLARWLRTIGYDTLYAEGQSDEAIAEQARREDRIVLTRDMRFAESFPDVRVFTMREENPWHQLVAVIREFHLDPDRDFLTRCTLCNALVEEADKEAYRDRIPPVAFQHADRFWICPGCQRLYWEGSHVERMRQQLDEIRRAVQSNQDEG
jgi:uncharacterized protein with PIN domain